MTTTRSIVASVIAAAILFGLGGTAFAGSRLRGWVTQVDPAAWTIVVDGQTIPTGNTRVTGGPLEVGVFVSVKNGRIKVEAQRRPADDQIIHFPAKGLENPGRVEFSHLRHFNALGEKQCKTCHSPEMGLLTSPSYASRASDPALEPHGQKSIGRFCGSCHNGTTRLGQVGALAGRLDAPIFTAVKTGSPRSCERCHAPADHGNDFTARHGDIAEHRGRQACRACHALAWGPTDRRLHADLLAAERTLKANPDDPTAALAVGPNNFCVYCHRRDGEWRDGE